MKLSALTISYTQPFTEVKMTSAADSCAISFVFLLVLCKRMRLTFFRIMPQMFTILLKPNIFLLGLYNYY